MTASTPDRRILIVDSAIDLIATQGLRALTHRALDTALELPAGSASYYFRTKRALIEAIVERIATRSRTDFAGMERTGGDPIDPNRIARSTATWLDRLLAQRRNHLIVRHTLIIDLLGDAELHGELVGCLFSHRHATTLFETLGAPDPATAAADFIAVIEGLIFDRFAGARTALAAGTRKSVDQLAAVLAVQLAAIAASRQ